MNHQTNMAFVRSCRHAFETLFSMEVDVGDPVVWRAGGAAPDVRARVTLSGEANGRFELGMPVETARRLATVFSGVEVENGDELLPDALGEIAGIIAGGGAARLGSESTDLSCPEVAFGVHLSLHPDHGSAGVRIPCACDCGEFTLGVALRPAPSAWGRAAA